MATKTKNEAVILYKKMEHADLADYSDLALNALLKSFMIQIAKKITESEQNSKPQVVKRTTTK
ncbi:MAG: hypothetical protein QW478_06490 [Candidatus Micrarchaeaceae archaeon]